ncbi:MAG: 3-deoxy-D-manno-octulosonic acid transferase [Synergistaceae bacterium]|nr:3-deoxy-D-manno-octulosonic acid transferase [Synergistaceae bacterium]
MPRDSLWIHAVSVGEAQSAWPLMAELRALEENAPSVLLSTTTRTGREMALGLARELFDRHIYYPWDVPKVVSRSLDAVRPSAYAVMETEIWPNMLFALARRGIPAFLVNGRISDRSAKARRSAFWGEVYGCFSRLMVRSESDRDVLLALGVEGGRIVVTGDCKVDALLMRRRCVDQERARDMLFGPGEGRDGRPLFLAGSTHEGEEEAALEAFNIVRRSLPDARLVLAPRHPERAGGVLELANACAESLLLSSPAPRIGDIIVVDRIGVLFDLYSVADAAFIGGSLVDRGGQNIMEPAAFGTPLCHGPFMRDFTEAAFGLGELRVARSVECAGDIADHWEASLRPDFRDEAREGAARFFRAAGGAARRSAEEIIGVMGR